jgi:hypothetical protein
MCIYYTSTINNSVEESTGWIADFIDTLYWFGIEIVIEKMNKVLHKTVSILHILAQKRYLYCVKFLKTYYKV